MSLVTRYRGMGDAEAQAVLAKDRSVSCDYGGLGPTRRSVASR